MENRRRFLMLANALLYFGPLLAGLAGFGWGLVAVFTAIFVLWLIILQPYEFPINRAEWISPDAWVAIGARAAVQFDNPARQRQAKPDAIRAARMNCLAHTKRLPDAGLIVRRNA